VRGYADQMLRIKDNPTDPSNRRISILVKNETENVPIIFADKVVNGSTPLPGTPKAEALQQDNPKDQKASAPPATQPSGSSSAAQAAPQPKPSAATPTATPAAPPPKQGMIEKLKSLLPGKK